MRLREDSTVLPEVVLCSRDEEVGMEVVSRELVDGVVNYELPVQKKDLGTITKVRVGMDNFYHVRGKEKTTPQVSFILKMRLLDTANGDELLFPDPFVALQPRNSICVIEFPAAWPDSTPPKGIVFEIYMQTKTSIGSFNVRVKLLGDRGLHSGFRLLEEPGVDDLFGQDTEKMLRIQALHLGELQAVEVTAEAKEPGESFEWQCAEIRVVNTGNLHYYEFDCGATFTNENRHEVFPVAPIPIAHSV
uniref:PLAT domain-containing protein n=1 Tax=Steinernema glaseri TaxID=37863 RepID=A0A1I7Z3Q9_9BILA